MGTILLWRRRVAIAQKIAGSTSGFVPAGMASKLNEVIDPKDQLVASL